jgi:hypothetical protein
MPDMKRREFIALAAAGGRPAWAVISPGLTIYDAMP